MDHRTADDYSSFFSVLGGSILTSRSLLYGTGFQEYTGDQSAPAYADECELFLPVTEKSLPAMKSNMEYLWRQGLPLCIEVKGQKASFANSTTLLERWLVQTVAKRPQAHHTSLHLLLQAVQSFLHFSQIRSWAVFHDGSLPFDLVCRVCTPAEENWEHFTLCKVPEVHVFPPATITNQLTLQVTVTYLPRSEGIPALLGGGLCLHGDHLNGSLQHPPAVPSKGAGGIPTCAVSLEKCKAHVSRTEGDSSLEKCGTRVSRSVGDSSLEKCGTRVSRTEGDSSLEKCGTRVSRSVGDSSLEKCEAYESRTESVEKCRTHISRTEGGLSLEKCGTHVSRTMSEATDLNHRAFVLSNGGGVIRTGDEASINKCGSFIIKTGDEVSSINCGTSISRTGDEDSNNNCILSRTGDEASNTGHGNHALHTEETNEESSDNKAIILDSAHLPSPGYHHRVSNETAAHNGALEDMQAILQPCHHQSSVSHGDKPISAAVCPGDEPSSVSSRLCYSSKVSTSCPPKASSPIPSVMIRKTHGDCTLDRTHRRSFFLPVKTPLQRSPQRSMSVPAAVPSLSLLGTFEESVLNGRIEACGYLEGFEAELAASGSFCPRHVLLPMTTAFFDLSRDVGTSPYLGHINLMKLGKKGYHVPPKGTVQVTLFNPNKTVVKIFIVMYDLSDMPSSTQTFLRQRTLSRSTVVQHQTTSPSLPVLHYLIHLRFASSKSGRVYLHTDIRVIFARRAPDNDPDISKVSLSTLSEGPTNPKYSPIDLS